MSDLSTAFQTNEIDEKQLYQITAKYQKPHLGKAIWQIANTFVPYIALWVLMAYTIRQGYPYWLTLLLAALASGFLVRIFIFFHDCGHQSFFASRLANTILGYISGILVFTPFEDWSHAHGIHHNTAGDLDRRGTGDVWTMTVKEYLAAPWQERLAYRLFRTPIITFILGPIGVFILGHRFPAKGANRRDVISVIVTDIAVLGMIISLSLVMGFRTYLLIQLPLTIMGGGMGVWLFYVQHQFEGVYWARHDKWNRIKSALEGSSYYKLPKVLQWFTGNIGLHHIHHIRPRIPNYNLQRAYDEVEVFQQVKPVTVGGSLKSLRMHLWDEERQELVSFRSLRVKSQASAV
jgi:omega-6 fatty acid desaturase (delta-12 desaturase)